MRTESTLLEDEAASLTGGSPGYSDIPVRLGTLASVRRHPFLTVVPIVVLVLVAIAYSLQRTPTYTAEARMTVGSIDLNQPGALNGFATATQALATAYSRAIGAQEVIQKVAGETGLDPLTVRARLNSSPIPQSPLFRINATASSAAQAQAIANSASEALGDYVRESNEAPLSASDALLRTYEKEQVRVSKASQRLGDARLALQADRTPANKAALADAQARFSAAQLRANVASTTYTSSAGTSTTTGSVRVLAPATFATNDRGSKTQIFVFIALVAGAFLGAALAMLMEDRHYRRSLRNRVG